MNTSTYTTNQTKIYELLRSLKSQKISPIFKLRIRAVARLYAVDGRLQPHRANRKNHSIFQKQREICSGNELISPLNRPCIAGCNPSIPTTNVLQLFERNRWELRRELV